MFCILTENNIYSFLSEHFLLLTDLVLISTVLLNAYFLMTFQILEIVTFLLPSFALQKYQLASFLDP